MRKATSLNLQIAWYMLIGLIMLVSFMPNTSLHNSFICCYINSDWVRFFVFAIVAAIPLLAWRIRVGIVLSFGTAIVTAVSQVLYGVIIKHVIDVQCILISLLGIAAGILLALNLLKLQSLND
jgi:hypothetical protein